MQPARNGKISISRQKALSFVRGALRHTLLDGSARGDRETRHHSELLLGVLERGRAGAQPLQARA